MIDLTQKEIERFWQKVDKGRSSNFYNNTRCWEWTSSRRGRYGSVKIRKKKYGAHRVSYRLSFGDIPDGLLVCHHCDNTLCCNPSHLFLGTSHDNSVDRDRKKRTIVVYGEKHGQHKLTDEQVAEIRKRYAPYGIGGEDSVTLGKIFGVRGGTIRKIVLGQRRQHGTMKSSVQENDLIKDM